MDVNSKVLCIEPLGNELLLGTVYTVVRTTTNPIGEDKRLWLDGKPRGRFKIKRFIKNS